MASPLLEPPRAFVDPPPREPWETPAPGGWGSSVRGVGLATFAVVALGLLAIGEVRLVYLARRMGRHHPHGAHHTWWLLAWAAALVIGASLALYVWRQRETLGLLLAMVSDTGRAARLRGRPPVFLDAPPERALRVAQLSDLHLAEGPTVRLVERATVAGNTTFANLLESPALDESDVVLITGDITDRGTAAAWRSFFELLDARGLADKTVLVPGNHDLALVEPFEPFAARELLHPSSRPVQQALASDRFGVTQLANLLKFAAAFSRTGGGRRGLVVMPGATAHAAGAPVPFVEAFALVERSVRPFIESLPDEPVPPPRRYPFQRGAIADYERRIEAARRQLLALFPVAVRFVEKEAVIFVLNSCVPVSRHPATNALGGLGASQLARLERLASSVPANLKLVALHHHLVRRGEEAGSNFTSRFFASFSTLGDARRVIRFCDAEKVRAVWNGHRHLSYQLRLPGGTVLLAAPSSTLGDELADDPRPQLERYDIAPLAEGPSVGIYRRVVRPPGTEISGRVRAG